MSIFREHKTSADRSAQDRARHKEKIEKAIKEGIHNIIADESIIGKEGKTKIRLPVKGIKEYKFIYGDNESNKRTGTAPGKDKSQGDVVGKGPPQDGAGGGNKAGTEAGEEHYEVEITISDLASYLFDDLKLPDLEKKQLKDILDKKLKRSGHRNQGIRPRLDKKETLKKKIRRTAMKKQENESSDNIDDEDVMLNERDLRYRHVENKMQENTNAVVFFVMDVSGSMGKEKKYLARSFYFLLYQFLHYKYEKIEIVFISHTTDAKEVDEKEFFTRIESGGTYISPALRKVEEIINTRYYPTNWNIYAFHCSDGDNWDDDIQKAVSASEELKKLCQMYCYCEITPLEDIPRWDMAHESVMMTNYKPLVDKKFQVVKILSKNDVWPGFKKIFGGKIDV